MSAISIAIIALNLLGTPVDGLDSLLQVQRSRADAGESRIFAPLDNPGEWNLGPGELEDLRFLIAYLPLADLASMTGGQLVRNVRMANRARENFSWGDEISEELYRHFVLPHRVSQEPFIEEWRRKFFDALKTRLNGLSMTEAALEVNHWCHEMATFVQTTGRDQDPLTTIRSGFGRCEEEMILAIAALRSVGIPARQCYTPYWAHTDNNHAWVEVWADGDWHYFGACEPKPALDDAWFTRSAGRAMMVVSTAYGDYRGTEPVLRRYPRSTLINSTAVYGRTRDLTVSLFDHNDKAVRNQRVIFNLFNYGAIMPALALNTDESGRLRLPCGRGGWILSAGREQNAVLAYNTWESEIATLQWNTENELTRISQIEYTPPPPLPELEPAAKDSIFACRITMEDSLRERHYPRVWADEAGIVLPDDVDAEPDSVDIATIAVELDVPVEALWDIIKKARGNWGRIYRFLTGEYPTVHRPMAFQAVEALTESGYHARFLLLTTLRDKDLRDFTIPVLEDHLKFTTLRWRLNNSDWSIRWDELDEQARDRIGNYVIAPRISSEPSSEWRFGLCDFIEIHPEFLKSGDDEALIGWIRTNVVEIETPDRLGHGLSPIQTLTLSAGSRGDIKRLYVGLCRVRGIPARFNEVSGRLERWEGEQGWKAVTVLPPKKGRGKDKSKTGQLVVRTDEADSTLLQARYFKDWAVQRWETDHTSPVDFGFKKPFQEMEFPKELPVGLYCLSSGFRREDGSSPVKLTWFRIEPNGTTTVDLAFLPLKE